MGLRALMRDRWAQVQMKTRTEASRPSKEERLVIETRRGEERGEREERVAGEGREGSNIMLE